MQNRIAIVLHFKEKSQKTVQKVRRLSDTSAPKINHHDNNNSHKNQTKSQPPTPQKATQNCPKIPATFRQNHHK
jgi:hypothetical protein